MSDLVERTRQWVKESLEGTGFEDQFEHLQRTAHWIKQLKPDANDALLIAALTHDIDKPFIGLEKFERKMKSRGGPLSEKYLEWHENRSAEAVSDFLKGEDADPKLIEEVKSLVSKHEEGGSERQDLLKDADSISWFENNVEQFTSEEMIERLGREEIMEKIKWMYDRITSKKGREMAKKWFEEAKEKLGKGKRTS